MKKKISRRDFFEHSTLASAGVVAGGILQPQETFSPTEPEKERPGVEQGKDAHSFVAKLPSKYVLDLAPSRWIWYPAERTLCNTFILFRNEFDLASEVETAQGWILGDSRYLIEVNRQRIQWVPAPADPRYAEADPIDVSDQLKKGRNVIGATVLY